MIDDNSIHAVIAVWHEGAKTFYVQRSAKMANYPLTWSLLSIQIGSDHNVFDPFDLHGVQTLMNKMSQERLCGAQIPVDAYLSSATCSDNPMRRRVVLHMYEVHLLTPPKLNPDFYIDSTWLNPAEYEQRVAGATCGLCMRMWSDHCVRHGLVSKPFAPALSDE